MTPGGSQLPYVVAFLDQTIARDHQLLPATAANLVESVTVLQLPTPTVAKLHFGNGDGIPLLANLLSFRPGRHARDGVMVSNSASAGVLILLVAFRQLRQREGLTLQAAGAGSGGGAGGTVDQGLPAILANAWPVKVTDGVNLLPTMDAAARAAFVQLVFAGAAIDPRAIRALTVADVVTAAQGAAAGFAAPWPVGISVGGVQVDPRAIRALAGPGDTVGIAGNVGVVQQSPWLVRGSSADGVAPVGGSVPIAGVDGAGLTRTVRVFTDGTVAVAGVQPATLHVTATAAVATALTLTLPAAGAGLFHYITAIQVVKLYAVVGVAAAAGVLITSTNLPGNPVWTTEQAAGALGTAPRVIDYQPTNPLRSAVANTATTLVAPAQAQTIWRMNVSYYTGV